MRKSKKIRNLWRKNQWIKNLWSKSQLKRKQKIKNQLRKNRRRKNQNKNKQWVRKRGQKQRDKKRMFLKRKINQLIKRRKIIREQMKFSWQWCKLNINHLPRKIKMEIREPKRDQTLLNQIGDAAREVEVVVVVNEVTEEAWLLIKEMMTTLVKRIKLPMRLLRQNKMLLLLTITLNQLKRKRNQMKKNHKLNRRNQRPPKSPSKASKMLWKLRIKKFKRKRNKKRRNKLRNHLIQTTFWRQCLVEHKWLKSKSKIRSQRRLIRIPKEVVVEVIKVNVAEDAEASS